MVVIQGVELRFKSDLGRTSGLETPVVNCGLVSRDSDQEIGHNCVRRAMERTSVNG